MLKRFLRCQAAAVAVEYALLIGLIGLGIAAAAFALGLSIEKAFAFVAELF